MALVWYVDKFPRSRKPVQYRLLEDWTASGAMGNDLLPILLPCALCCEQQQMSTTLVGAQLFKDRIRNQSKSQVAFIEFSVLFL